MLRDSFELSSLTTGTYHVGRVPRTPAAMRRESPLYDTRFTAQHLGVGVWETDKQVFIPRAPDDPRGCAIYHVKKTAPSKTVALAQLIHHEILYAWRANQLALSPSSTFRNVMPRVFGEEYAQDHVFTHLQYMLHRRETIGAQKLSVIAFATRVFDKFHDRHVRNNVTIPLRRTAG